MKHKKHLINTLKGVVILASLKPTKIFNAVFPVLLFTTIDAILYSYDIGILPYLKLFFKLQTRNLIFAAVYWDSYYDSLKL